MVHISHRTWKVLILVVTGLVILMLAEVAAARDGLDTEAFQQPPPIEKAADPRSGIHQPPHRMWKSSVDPRPGLAPLMRTVEGDASQKGNLCRPRSGLDGVFRVSSLSTHGALLEAEAGNNAAAPRLVLLLRLKEIEEGYQAPVREGPNV